MTNEPSATFSDEPEKELDALVRDTTPPRERLAALTRLLVAFESRRRRREAIAISETAKGAAEAARAAG
jgi:hypothetical protein